MNKRFGLNLFALLLGLLSGPSAHALTTSAAGSVLVFPIVAQTGTFSSEIIVRNYGAIVPITLNVNFYESLGSANPGQRPCAQLTIAPLETKAFQLGTQCTLGGGSHFGMLILEDAAVEKINTFFAYSRTQNFAAQGFSVEAFPIGNFSGSGSEVIGLKRTAAAPAFQSNCFIAALGEAVDYQIQLFDGTTAAPIGNTVTGSLQPYQMVRYLDIFAAAGAPAGDYQNARAGFDDTNADPANPAYVGFCTVQDNVSFGADFRIAKSFDASDNLQRRIICYGQSPCGTLTVPPTQITDVTFRNIHWLIIRPPDYLRCDLISPRVNDLEIQLRGPGDTFTSPVWVSSPPYSSGGNNMNHFYIFTGPRNSVNSGIATRWFIDVSFREGGNATVPIDYGITCYSGNGVSHPYFRAGSADNF